MTDESPPPTPLPPAAEPPYPLHPAPHGATYSIPVAKREPSPSASVSGLGATLIGGAIAATIGLIVAIPLFRRRRAAKPAPARRPRRQRKTA